MFITLFVFLESVRRKQRERKQDWRPSDGGRRNLSERCRDSESWRHSESRNASDRRR